MSLKTSQEADRLRHAEELIDAVLGLIEQLPRIDETDDPVAMFEFQTPAGMIKIMAEAAEDKGANPGRRSGL